MKGVSNAKLQVPGTTTGFDGAGILRRGYAPGTRRMNMSHIARRIDMKARTNSRILTLGAITGLALSCWSASAYADTCKTNVAGTKRVCASWDEGPDPDILVEESSVREAAVIGYPLFYELGVLLREVDAEAEDASA